MKDGRKVRVEDLVFPNLIAGLGEVMPVDEAAVTTTLHPLFAHKKAGPPLIFAAMARTATLFLVDHGEYAEALASVEAAPLLPELPPLPYPRIAVECLEDATWQMGDGERHLLDLMLFFIAEMERGRSWTVVLLCREPKEDEDDFGQFQPWIDAYTIFSDGRVEHYFGPEDVPDKGDYIDMTKVTTEVRVRVYAADDPRAISMRAIPIEFAHIVNARGVTVEPVGIPRPQRRRFTRNKLVHPQVYFVKIGGEDIEGHPGHGDRQYHCRWLVRGHYVRNEHGEFVIPGKGRCYWRRPYIKGPAGAPWRGRPVYVVEPLEEAS
jgi:hypothetical protein